MNKSLVKACIGCEDISMMLSEVSKQIEKLEVIKDRSEKRDQIIYHKKTPTQLSYLLKG